VTDTQVHVYGVVRSTASLPDDLSGRGGRPARLVSDDDLAVIVSDVDEPGRVRRADLLAHAHLLESVAEDNTVIPSRFGIAMPDDDTVRHEFLQARRDHLLGLLDAFEGCVQVTVQATYEEDAALREVLRDPTLAALRARTNADDPSAQMQLGETVARAVASLCEQTGSVVVESLRPHALAASLNEAPGAYDVASVALLVRRSDRDRVDAAVAELDRRFGGQVLLRYVGPQPPYAFLDHVVIQDKPRERSWA